MWQKLTILEDILKNEDSFRYKDDRRLKGDFTIQKAFTYSFVVFLVCCFFNTSFKKGSKILKRSVIPYSTNSS